MVNQNVQPIFILPEDTLRNTGKNAQKINIAAAKAVADTIRTTLGPKGMDKMLVDAMGDVVITNDGVTILDEMAIEHPAAKMMVEIAKVQEDEVGDGTTTAVILGGELLKGAEDLLDKNIHSTVIANGYKIASEKAQEILQKISVPVSSKDVDILKKVATTAMYGKNVEWAREKLAGIAVNAILHIMEKTSEGEVVDISNIKIEKKEGGSSENSELVSGVVIDKERVHYSMPRLIKNAKVLLLDCPLEIKETETDAKISITSPEQLQSFLDQEERMLKDMVGKVVASGANVVFCQKGIDDVAQYELAKKGVLAARRVKKSDMEKLSKATDGNILSNVNAISKDNLGFAGVVEEKKLGDESMIFVERCRNPKAVSIIVRGGTEHAVDEVERALNDAVGDVAAAITVGKCVAGGGAVETELSKRLREFSEGLSGREQLAVKAFADALEIIPRTLAENGGLDPIDTLTELKARHDDGNVSAGLDVFTGKTEDMWKRGVIEPLKIKTQAIQSASEAAVMLLRIDDIIASGQARKGAGMPGMPGGMPEM